MEFLQDSIPKVYLAAAAAALYARASSSLLRPGLPRLVALLPVLAFLAAAPLAFTSCTNVRGTAAFFLAWLGAFKVALLAAGRGPLDPALPVLTFLFTALLPVKLRGAAAPAKASKPVSLVSCAVKVAVIAVLLWLYQFSDRMHLYVRLALYGVHMYCFFDLLLPCIAAAGGALGMEMEPQFDRPYLASSLRDFWGWRWNLMVSAILRPSVYDPVRVRAGSAAGVLASFAVSGLIHEAMVCYLSLRWPPSGGMAAFFVLHGVCCRAGHPNGLFGSARSSFQLGPNQPGPRDKLAEPSWPHGLVQRPSRAEFGPVQLGDSLQPRDRKSIMAHIA